MNVSSTTTLMQPLPHECKFADESTFKDFKVINFLFQAIGRSTVETIIVRKTSKNIWDSTNKNYQGSTNVKWAQLWSWRHRFEVLIMRVNELIYEYFARTFVVVKHMKAQGENRDQILFVEKILDSWPQGLTMLCIRLRN